VAWTSVTHSAIALCATFYHILTSSMSNYWTGAGLQRWNLAICASGIYILVRIKDFREGASRYGPPKSVPQEWSLNGVPRKWDFRHSQAKLTCYNVSFFNLGARPSPPRSPQALQWFQGNWKWLKHRHARRARDILRVKSPWRWQHSLDSSQ